MTKGLPSRLDQFQRYFSVKLATTPQQMDQVFALRYRVFCEELQLEPAELFPGHRESDAFDGHSRHCLVIHRRSGQVAGCVRLVRPGPQHLMPFERHCLDALRLDNAERFYDMRAESCEISRIAVDHFFRRRCCQHVSTTAEQLLEDCCDKERSSFSLIGVALALAGVAMAAVERRPYMLAMMEAGLPRRLRRLGMPSERLGGAVDYHGRRSLYLLDARQIVAQMDPQLASLYRSILEAFDPTLRFRLHVA
jgi:N-acyl amino acid synthase of PEP-CTERM/exosortase system